MLEIMYVSVWGTYLRWYENADETKPEIEIGSNQKGPDGIDLHFSLAIWKGFSILAESIAFRHHSHKNRANPYAERMR